MVRHRLSCESLLVFSVDGNGYFLTIPVTKLFSNICERKNCVVKPIKCCGIAQTRQIVGNFIWQLDGLLSSITMDTDMTG